MSPRLNRRELLVAGGAVGAAAAAVSALGNQAEAGVELGRYARRAGVQGKMTAPRRRPRHWPVKVCAACLGFRGRRPTSCGTRSRPGRALLAGRQRSFGQRDGRCIGPRDGRGRGLLGGARSGTDQRH